MVTFGKSREADESGEGIKTGTEGGNGGPVSEEQLKGSWCRIKNGGTGGNGPSVSEDIVWGERREASLLENSTKGQGPGPSAPLLGHRKGVREGVPSSLDHLQRRNRFVVEGRGRSCQCGEHRKGEGDGLSPGLKLGVEAAIKRGVGTAWSFLSSFPGLLCSRLGNQQAQGQPLAHHSA